MVDTNDNFSMHERMIKVLDMVVKQIKRIKKSDNETNIKWPMIIVLHNVIVFTEIPFLLISRKENCTETILIKYETRHYTFFLIQ